VVGFHVERRLASRRHWLAMFGIIALGGCVGGDSGDTVGLNDPFYDSDWIYYYEGDDYDFLAGLTEEQKDALRQRWDALPNEDKLLIRDQWNQLSTEERAQVREAWERLDASQRQAVITSMHDRVQSGTLRAVTPVQAGPSRFLARPSAGVGRSRVSSRAGGAGRGGSGGRGGMGGGGGGLGGRR
jgi:hypothetical protein